MTIRYPATLPLGLHSGRSNQIVSPLLRSDLVSGRARQRRLFTSVPQMVSISWLFNGAQSRVFESWWRDALIDGSAWFDMPLDAPLGFANYACRFTGAYNGPDRVGPDLWSYSAQLEMRERPLLEPGWGLFPEFIENADIVDLAMNRQWPLNPWQVYIEQTDQAMNEEWPTP